MARQIQIRRGTATENNAFTGAIGEVTMDTTNKTLRVHDGATAGGTVLAKQSDIPVVPNVPTDIMNADYVIESQIPTAENNYTWYRKYKSGWIEQGGKWTGSITKDSGQEITFPISLPITMNSSNYVAVAVNSMKNFCVPGGIQKDTNKIVVTFLPYNITRTLTSVDWFVIGKQL